MLVRRRSIAASMGDGLWGAQLPPAAAKTFQSSQLTAGYRRGKLGARVV